jgi:hypothetical protein
VRTGYGIPLTKTLGLGRRGARSRRKGTSCPNFAVGVPRGLWREADGQACESSEVKGGCPESEQHSPEKHPFWESAETMRKVAGNRGSALETSVHQPPGVSDSIELDNDDGVTRRASERPKGSWRNIPDRVDSSRVWSPTHRRRPDDADARDGNQCDRNGLAMKRLTPAERRFPQ